MNRIEKIIFDDYGYAFILVDENNYVKNWEIIEESIHRNEVESEVEE